MLRGNQGTGHLHICNFHISNVPECSVSHLITYLKLLAQFLTMRQDFSVPFLAVRLSKSLRPPLGAHPQKIIKLCYKYMESSQASSIN